MYFEEKTTGKIAGCEAHTDRQLAEGLEHAFSVGVPRVALRVPEEAAASLGVSADYFNKHVRPELRLIRRGRLPLVTLSELQRWGRENEQQTLG